MTASADRWPDAALAGVSASMRTFTPAALLALRGRLGGRGRPVALALAATELISDKTAFARERIDAPSVGARLTAGAHAGNALAGPVGAGVGAGSALVSTFATYRARKLVASALGIPDPWCGAAEDLVALSAAAVATREVSEDDDAPPAESALRAAARGLAAGVAGTAAMTLAQGAYYQLTGARPSDAPGRVARKAAEQAGAKIPRRHRGTANHAMHWLYGSSWGVPYGVIAATAGARPEPSGVAFGLAVWGVGMAHLPALGLAPPPWEQSPRALASDAAFHVVYGLGAAGALRALSPRSPARSGPR